MEIQVEVGGRPVSASVHGEGPTTLVLGHGAGGTRAMPWLVAFADLMASHGRRVLLHNFPYSEAGGRRIDPAPLLEATVSAFVAHARPSSSRIVAGGRSMGGRMASRAVAAGLAVDALVFLAYPLHPPGEFGKLRDAHLPAITAPRLWVQGTRDEFARPDLLEATLARLGPRATLLSVAGGDHGFAMPRAARRPADDVRREIADGAHAWLAGRGL